MLKRWDFESEVGCTGVCTIAASSEKTMREVGWGMVESLLDVNRTNGEVGRDVETPRRCCLGFVRMLRGLRMRLGEGEGGADVLDGLGGVLRPVEGLPEARPKMMRGMAKARVLWVAPMMLASRSMSVSTLGLASEEVFFGGGKRGGGLMPLLLRAKRGDCGYASISSHSSSPSSSGRSCTEPEPEGIAEDSASTGRSLRWKNDLGRVET